MITLLLFIASALIAVGYFIGRTHPAGRQRTAPPEKQEPTISADQRRVALNDIAYHETQLSRLYELMDCAKLDLIAARRSVQNDTDANRYGAVVSENIATKHAADLDRALRRVMALEQRIHTNETALEKLNKKIGN